MTASTTTEAQCPQCGATVPLPAYADVAVCGSCGSTLAPARLPEEPPRADPASSDAAAPAEQVLHSVRCPQCAGPLGASEGRRVLKCAHCGVRVALKRHDGISRWYFPPGVDRLEAIRSGVAWLGRYPGITKRARDARFTEAQLVYAPIWEHKALVAGWEFGSRTRTHYELVGDEHSERLDLRLAREAVEEPHLQERRFYQAATDLSALGATRPRITGRELLLPLLAGELDPSARVLEAEGVAAQVAARGRSAALMPMSGAIAPDTHLFAFRESMALLYYPLWLLGYQDGNRRYRMVVNGRDGTVNSATAPAADWGRLALLMAKVAALAAVVGLLVWLGVAWSAVRLSTVVVAVVVFMAAVFLMWRFRAQREIEYHEPFSS